MELKLMCLLLFFLGVVLNHVGAAFFYNPDKPASHELEQRGLKCVPGRTIVKMSTEEHHDEPANYDSDQDARREHMTKKSTDETCRVCVCSVEGKDEYCSNRPARNINECIVMAKAIDEYTRNVPFNHERTIYHAIRRGGANRGLTRPSCIPFVSEYNNCNHAMTCKGCTRCSCNSEGQWSCYKAQDTCGADQIMELGLGDEEMEGAMSNLIQDMNMNEEMEKARRPKLTVPLPPKRSRKPTTLPQLPLGYIIAFLR